MSDKRYTFVLLDRLCHWISFQ